MTSNSFSIRAEGIGKQFRINKSQPRGKFRYSSLREDLARMLTSPFRALASGAALGDTTEFDALSDVSFGITPGERVGIIGRNGAGKSTLLKVLSRITKPTTGRIEICGRVGSLLEVGTGFHPELSGRDNIYLNGAILGMSRREIAARFDEIVAFAEVEKFLDTPVKRYSSGMYVRLAFAVAAHLEPEILIVDEVLAVGDVAFQKKCLNKMEEVGEGGRTVLFVSHNMPSITRLCDRAIMLVDGRVRADGPSHEVVGTYLRDGMGTSAERTWSKSDPRTPGNEVAQLRRVALRDTNGAVKEAFSVCETIDIEVEFDVLTSDNVVLGGLEVFNADGTCLFSSHERTPVYRSVARERGSYRTHIRIPANVLAEGTHVIGVSAFTLEPLKVHYREFDCVAFEVVDQLDGKSARVDYGGPMPGVVRPMLDWKSERISTASTLEKATA